MRPALVLEELDEAEAGRTVVSIPINHLSRIRREVQKISNWDRSTLVWREKLVISNWTKPNGHSIVRVGHQEGRWGDEGTREVAR